MKKDLVLGGEFPIIRFMFLIIAVVHNFTEASISKGGLVWFVMLLAITAYPSTYIPHTSRQRSRIAKSAEPPESCFDETQVAVASY
jgi:hypothetical protein